MVLLEVVETSQEHVVELRHELDKVRDALDRTDAVLAIADETLMRAEGAIIQSRRWAPVVLGVVGLLAVGVTVAIVIRRRSDGSELRPLRRSVHWKWGTFRAGSGDLEHMQPGAQGRPSHQARR